MGIPITHRLSSLYKTFTAVEAKRIPDRLGLRYEPEQDSWLNMAELEVAILQRHCLTH